MFSWLFDSIEGVVDGFFQGLTTGAILGAIGGVAALLLGGAAATPEALLGAAAVGGMYGSVVGGPVGAAIGGVKSLIAPVVEVGTKVAGDAIQKIVKPDISEQLTPNITPSQIASKSQER